MLRLRELKRRANELNGLGDVAGSSAVGPSETHGGRCDSLRLRGMRAAACPPRPVRVRLP